MTSSLKTAQEWLNNADAILITASNGFSISEGLNLFADNEALHGILGDLVENYHLSSILMALSYNYPNALDQWRAYSRIIYYYGIEYQPGSLMTKLKEIINDKPFFIWTSNIDHYFVLAGLTNILEIEGNWLEGIYTTNDHKHKIVNLTNIIKEIHQKDQQGTLTEADLPKDKDGSPITLNIAGDNFQMNQQQVINFTDFITQYQEKKIVVLELGIGPHNQMIKAPSMQLVAGNPQSHYITINKGQVMIPKAIADRAIGFSSTIETAFDELITGKDYGAKIDGPAKPQPELTPEQKAEQEKVLQQFYPHYMVNRSVRPNQLTLYLTVDHDHPSYLHLVPEGQSWMYSLGDATIAHCFTQDGTYYQVRLGLNKERGEVHGFYIDTGTFVAFENANDSGAGFSQISGTLPSNSDTNILVPKTQELIKLFPEQKEIIQKFTADNL